MRADDPTPLPVLARVGDSIETDVRHPVTRVIRVRLQTVDSCAAGNALLLDPSSGWRLAPVPTVANPAGECP